MKPAAPIRFLALVLGLWVGARFLILAPAWLADAPATRPATATAQRPAPAQAPAYVHAAAPPAAMMDADRSLIRDIPYKGQLAGHLFEEPLGPFVPGFGAPRLRPLPGPGPELEASGLHAPPFILASAPGAPVTRAPAPGRWSGSAWILARGGRGAGTALAPGGTLGGGQAGARLLYRVDGGVALSGRVYLPIRRSRGAEAAAGLDWQPTARLPLHLLAERRQALAGEGRSAFAVTLYGGVSRDLPRGFRIDAYGQAGAVGLRSRDLFADGAARLSLEAGPVQLGAGAWAAAQPGAARLDVGPRASVRLPIRGVSLRLEADWRFRIAGDAAPGSGPALTLAADY